MLEEQQGREKANKGSKGLESDPDQWESAGWDYSIKTTNRHCEYIVEFPGISNIANQVYYKSI